MKPENNSQLRQKDTEDNKDGQEQRRLTRITNDELEVFWQIFRLNFASSVVFFASL